MSKELSPLEALFRLVSSAVEDDTRTVEECLEYQHIIETALKDCERRLSLAKEYKDVNNAAKRLKALDIIKRTKIDVDWFVGTFIKQDIDYAGFLICLKEIGNEGHLAEQLTMNEEEYELLKEVLI